MNYIIHTLQTGNLRRREVKLARETRLVEPDSNSLMLGMESAEGLPSL